MFEETREIVWEKCGDQEVAYIDAQDLVRDRERERERESRYKWEPWDRDYEVGPTSRPS